MFVFSKAGGILIITNVTRVEVEASTKSDNAGPLRVNFLFVD